MKVTMALPTATLSRIIPTRRQIGQFCDLLFAATMIACGVTMTYIIWLGVAHDGWEVLVNFNNYHEGITELILLSFMVVWGTVVLVRWLNSKFRRG